MKLSLTGKTNTILFSSKAESFHMGIEIAKGETVLIYHENKFLMVTANETGFHVEEKDKLKPA